MATIYYQTSPGDPEQTNVCDGRFQFKAFQPAEVSDDPAWADVVAKLKINPAFGESINEERKTDWDAWLISKRSA